MKHRANDIANAGSKPFDLSRFGCKGMGAGHWRISYDK